MTKSKHSFLSILIIFLTGALGYLTIEILWRGRTHWSMGLAGGLCFLSFSALWSKVKALPKIYIAILGSLIITVTEFILGLIFNIILKKEVWDYSHLPFNILGQVCILFSTLWGFLSLPFFGLAGKLKEFLTSRSV